MRRVVGAVAVIPDGDGKLRYFYAGSALPAGLDDDAVQRCIRRGLVAEVDDPEPDDPEPDDPDAEAKAAAEAEAKAKAEAEAAAAGGGGSSTQPPADPNRPRLTASTADWRAYRRPTHGDAVDGMNRQQLIELG